MLKDYNTFSFNNTALITPLEKLEYDIKSNNDKLESDNKLFKLLSNVEAKGLKPFKPIDENNIILNINDGFYYTADLKELLESVNMDHIPITEDDIKRCNTYLNPIDEDFIIKHNFTMFNISEMEKSEVIPPLKVNGKVE